MSDEMTLLPCPFCGSNKAYPNIELGKHWVECRECTAESGDYRTEAEAIAAWNTRVEPRNDHPKRNEQWTTVLLPDIAWRGADWPDYISVTHDVDGEWRVYVPEMNGTLTAEQVREAIRKYAEDDSCYIFEVYGEMCGLIADELNAKLGSGTCELLYGEDDDGYDGWYCDECGGWFQAVRRDGHLVKPKHCQECGKAVKR